VLFSFTAYRSPGEVLAGWLPASIRHPPQNLFE
jgi:hypothetical protein